jgi:hypothetical protein
MQVTCVYLLVERCFARCTLLTLFHKLCFVQKACNIYMPVFVDALYTHTRTRKHTHTLMQVTRTCSMLLSVHAAR